MKNWYKQVVPIFFALLVIGAVALVAGDRASAAGEGSISGTVKLNGTPPHMKGIDMSKDPYCVKQHEGSSVKMENVTVGSGGGLANVVLYISEGLSGAAASATASVEPSVDQKGCMYVPHVMVADVDQKYKVTTSDQTTHNIHPLPAPGSGNIGWNKSQPPGAPPIETTWKAAEMISVKCNIHPWMHGWHAVVKGPYALTDDSGNYTIKNVPPGSYTVTAWQEEYGNQTAKVTVSGGQAAKADFSFKAK